MVLVWIRNNLKDLKPENLYKAFNFSHKSRRFTEKIIARAPRDNQG